MVGTAQDAAAEGGEGTLVWGMPAETDILDPHATGGWLTYDVTYQIFESFAKEDLTDPNAATPELIPALATSWEISEDGLEYTFYLREGVKFHDGTPFDAAVAKFNFDRFWNESSPHFYAKSKAFVAAHTRWIENVEVIDDMTIKVTLNAPNYEWIRSGLQSYGQPLMISPTAVETFGNEGIALNPIGTGPFKFVEREQGVKTVIERNPDYWGRKAKLDRVIFRPLEDPATRINALRTGEIDMTNTPPWDDIQDLVDEGFHLTINENVPFIWFIHLNNRHPILQDVRVRRAMNMAVDRESLVREIFAGTGRAEYGMLRRERWPTIPTSAAMTTIPRGRRRSSPKPVTPMASSSSSTPSSTASAMWSSNGWRAIWARSASRSTSRSTSGSPTCTSGQGASKTTSA